MNLRVGTSGYSYNEWKGSFYPKSLPGKQMLRYYSERFPTLESNYTARTMPTVPLLQGWANEVPADFQFVLKAPQQITHFRRLNNVNELVSNLLDVTSTLNERLGPLLFQLPPNFKKDAPRLQAFLELLPLDRRVAFEFRHQSWFDDEILDLLGAQQAALCIAEAENDLDVPFAATTTWGFVRLRRYDYSDAELKWWLNVFREQQWDETFVFFKHEDEGNGPRMATRMVELNT